MKMWVSGCTRGYFLFISRNKFCQVEAKLTNSKRRKK